MKKFLMTLAAVAALFSSASCKPEDKPEEDTFDHFEFRSGLNYSKDVTDNFDLTYDILSNGVSVASGTMSGDLKPVEVKSGIKEGTLDVHFSFKAKDSFYKTWDIWKEYVISIDSFIALYAIDRKGPEQQLIQIGFSFKDATYSTFLESKIPEVIALMEDALAIDETFTIVKDETGKYIVLYKN